MICVSDFFVISKKVYEEKISDLPLVPDGNHEDADMCPMLHACFADTTIVVVAEDTDVSVLMVLAYCIEKHLGKGYFKIDHEKDVDTGKVVDCLGKDVSKNFPSIHVADI